MGLFSKHGFFSKVGRGIYKGAKTVYKPVIKGGEAVGKFVYKKGKDIDQISKKLKGTANRSIDAVGNIASTLGNPIVIVGVLVGAFVILPKLLDNRQQIAEKIK